MRVNYGRYIFGLVVIGVLTWTINYYKTPGRVGVSKAFAEERLAIVLADTTARPWNRSRQLALIRTAQDAIAIAEPILFNMYGKEKS